MTILLSQTVLQFILGHTVLERSFFVVSLAGHGSAICQASRFCARPWTTFTTSWSRPRTTTRTSLVPRRPSGVPSGEAGTATTSGRTFTRVELQLTKTEKLTRIATGSLDSTKRANDLSRCDASLLLQIDQITVRASLF